MARRSGSKWMRNEATKCAVCGNMLYTKPLSSEERQIHDSDITNDDLDIISDLCSSNPRARHCDVTGDASPHFASASARSIRSPHDRLLSVDSVVLVATGIGSDVVLATSRCAGRGDV